MMEPSEKSLNSPTSAVATKRAAVLGRFSAHSAMRSDHLDTVSLGQIPIQAVTVIGSVTDHPRWKGIEEAVSEEAFDEPAFVRRFAFHTDGERKTVIIGENEDFRPLAAFGRPDCETPFFAPAKVASMNASSRSSLPRACNSSASICKTRSSLPARTQC
jgi:hypothetical protein